MQRFLAWIEGLGTGELLLWTIALAVVVRAAFWVLHKLAQRTKTGVDDRIVAALGTPLFLSVVAIGLYAAIHRTGWSEGARGTTSALVVSVVILAWTRCFMRIGDAILDMLARRVDDYQWVEPRTLPLFEIVARLFVVGGAAYALLGAWGIDPTAWVASAGIVGIAVGFAAKDTLANLFAGLFILVDAPYKLGDFIILDSGERGRVTDIGIRSTRLLTRDDIEVTIPNAVIANAKIVNETGGPFEKERVRVDIGVAYGSDIDKVRALLEKCARECPRIVSAPPPTVRFYSFGDSGLNFQLRGYIDKPILRGRAVDALNTLIYKSFEAEGIEIPFPQRVVHLHRDHVHRDPDDQE